MKARCLWDLGLSIFLSADRNATERAFGRSRRKPAISGKKICYGKFFAPGSAPHQTESFSVSEAIDVTLCRCQWQRKAFGFSRVKTVMSKISQCSLARQYEVFIGSEGVKGLSLNIPRAFEERLVIPEAKHRSSKNWWCPKICQVTSLLTLRKSLHEFSALRT